MFEYYTAIVLMIIFSMVIMLISTKYNIVLDKKRRKSSAALFSLIIVGVFCEWCGKMISGKATTLIPLHIIVKTIELSSAPFVGLACGNSFADSKREKLIIYILCANVLLEVISAFTGIIFYVDASNIYYHGSLYFIYLLSYALGLIYFIGRCIETTRQYNGKYRLTIILTIVFVVVCIITQLMDSEIKIDWLAVAISASMLYKFYGDMLVQVDGLTGLLNHLSFEHILETINDEAILIFFDVDKFKKINDNYGHTIGDTCLKNVADCMKKTYSKYGMCFRYGGDEFSVVLTKNLNLVDRLNEEFVKEIEKCRKESGWMPMVSYGYVKYNHKTDNIHSAIDAADEMMYRYKEERR